MPMINFRQKQVKTEKICPVCLRPFLGYNDKIYCSQECKQRKANERFRTNACEVCGIPIGKQFKRCKKCYTKHTKFQCNQMIKMKREGKTVKEIALKFNCSIYSVYYALKKRKF